MPIPVRILRAWRDEEFGPLPVSPKEVAQKARILAAAEAILLDGGRKAMTMGRLAAESSVSIYSIKRTLFDVDNILFIILMQHLTGLAGALAAIPPNVANPIHALVDAYLGFVHAHPVMHRLLLKEAFHLPPDLKAPLAAMRHAVGETLAGTAAPLILATIDTEKIAAESVKAVMEAMFNGKLYAPPSLARAKPPNAAGPAEGPAFPPHLPVNFPQGTVHAKA